MIRMGVKLLRFHYANLRLIPVDGMHAIVMVRMGGSLTASLHETMHACVRTGEQVHGHVVAAETAAGRG